MKIQIDIGLNAAPHSQLSALIAAMMAYGSLTPDALADIVAPWDMPRRQAADSKAICEAFGVTRTFDMSIHPTLQGNRRIEPNDDPSAGVEKAALNSDARGELVQFSDESLTQRFNDEVVKPALAPIVASLQDVLPGADLAKVFGMAAKGPTNADIAGENQQSTNEQKDLGVQLDKVGLPWDSRIHAGSKAMVADGTWRQRRGVDPAIVATVEAELRQAMGVPVAGDTHGSPELDAGPTVGEVQTDEYPAEITARVTPPPPPRKPTSAAPPPPPAQAADTGEIDTFPRLLKFITEQKLAGRLAQAQVAAALIAIGIEGPLPVLQARPDLIPAMAAKLRAIGGV